MCDVLFPILLSCMNETSCEPRASPGSTSKWYISRRWIFTVLGFFGVMIIYGIRVNLSLAMVAMVNSTEETAWNGTDYTLECPNFLQKEDTSKIQLEGVKYNWDSKIQGFILSSFFYGYITTIFLGGVLSEKYGSKWLFGGGVLMTSVLYLMIPFAASWSVTAFVVIRALEGIVEGVTLPAITHAISQWAPNCERSRISSIVFSGIPVGMVVAMPLSSYLCSTDIVGGWPFTFYLFGATGCIWFLFWITLMSDTPESHPTISREELYYIQKNKDEKPKSKTAIPWKDMFLSLPTWAYIVAHTGNNYALQLFVTEMPTYIDDVLHVDIQMNGFLSALPFAAQAICSTFSSYIADKLRQWNVMSNTNLRKLINSGGIFGPAVCLIAITECGCQPMWILGFLCLAMFLNGFIYAGYNVTNVDMSPNFAGVIYGITSTIASVSGGIGPMVVGWMTSDGGTLENWNNIFYITSAVYIVSGIFFAMFASAELQPWDKGRSDANKDLKLKNETTAEYFTKKVSIDISRLSTLEKV